MGVVSITIPPIGLPPAPAASNLIDLSDVEAGAVGSAVGMFLTEIAPVAGSRRFGFMPATGGLAVADWDVTGEPLPLDPVAVGGELATVGGVATVTPSGVMPVMGGAAVFYGMTMPVALPTESATLDLIWPNLPTDVPAYVLTLLHDQSADLTALVESVLSEGAAGVSGLVAGAESGNGFGFTLPNADSFPLVLPLSGQNILLTVNSSGSLVFGGFGDDILIDSAAAGGYSISYLLLVMGVSEFMSPLSIDLSAATLGGGNGSAALPVDVSDLNTIYRVTSAGMYAGQALKQGDHVIFYNDQADFLVIRLPADFNPADVADLVSAAIAASLQAGGVVADAIAAGVQAGGDLLKDQIWQANPVARSLGVFAGQITGLPAQFSVGEHYLIESDYSQNDGNFTKGQIVKRLQSGLVAVDLPPLFERIKVYQLVGSVPIGFYVRGLVKGVLSWIKEQDYLFLGSADAVAMQVESDGISDPEGNQPTLFLGYQSTAHNQAVIDFDGLFSRLVFDYSKNQSVIIKATEAGALKIFIGSATASNILANNADLVVPDVPFLTLSNGMAILTLTAGNFYKVSFDKITPLGSAGADPNKFRVLLSVSGFSA